MLYSAYEWAYAAAAPARYAAGLGAQFWRSPLNPASGSLAARSTAAALDLFEHAMRRYPKPEWGLEATHLNGIEIPIEIDVAAKRSFCRLLHFKRSKSALSRAKSSDEPDPKVLIVAPMSGHYATLLRGTVEAMLPSHDVYITDWIDARNVPVADGRFDLNDFVEYLIDFMRIIGPGAAGERAHAMAVCQPGPALLAAASLMAEDDDPNRPASITLMGSPIDTRRSPTVPNLLSKERPFEWFQQNMIYTVPAPYAGILRRVYPGFVQLYSFLAMNSDRHMNAHYDYFQHLVAGDGDGAEKHRGFYDEYLSVMDMTEEFYLQTIREVFQEHTLPEGTFLHRGRRVKPEAIRDIALMTVEGEKDDISGIGQTQAAHDLCANIPDKMKIDYVQPGVGHYGVFNGSRWRSEIQPKLATFMRAHEAKPALRKMAAE
ncbi:MAG: polyhydroxyalkanoate depolymerase [Pseudomonadota bacterium]